MKDNSVIHSLSCDAKKFVQLQVLFTGMNTILTLFVNTFLLNSYGSFSKEVLFYNAIIALVQPIAMITAMKVSERKTALFTQRIGFIFYGIALAILSIWGNKVSSYYSLFAVLLSFGAGYYYAVYSSQVLCYTDDKNRDRIVGTVGLIGSVFSALLPSISGILISTCGSRTGYQIVFGIAAILAFLCLITNKLLPEIPKHKKEPTLKKVFKTILCSRDGRLIMLANGLCNCRSSTIPIFVTLLFYSLLPNELLIGVNSTIGYTVALLGATIFRSAVKSGNRVKFSIWAACVVMVPCLGLQFGLNVIGVIVFNAVHEFCNTFLASPVLNTHFKVIEDLNLHGEYGAEVHTVRELFVSAGRIAGLAIVWFAPKTNNGIAFALLSMMLTAVINAIILQKIKKRSDSV